MPCRVMMELAFRTSLPVHIKYVGSNHSYCPQRPARGRVYLSTTLKL